jgi:hypothetical protein
MYLGFRRAQERGSNLRGTGAEGERGCNPTPVTDTARRDDGNTNSINDGREQRKQADSLMLGSSSIKGGTMSTSLVALRHNHVRTSRFRFYCFRDRGDRRKPSDAALL